MLKYIEALLDKYLLPNTHFQDYINYRYDSNRYELINKKFLGNAFCEYNDAYYSVCNQLHSIDEVLTDYRYSDIRPSDTILDIGANIGGFTIPAAKKAKHVYAVEPLYTDLLRKNVEKNNLKNVTVLDTGIGSGTTVIEYGSASKEVHLTPFTNIIKRCGQIDFLKCDCEKCEWNIKPADLSGIRRIEIEVHRFAGNPPVISFKNKLREAGFKFESEPQSNGAVIFHCEAM